MIKHYALLLVGLWLVLCFGTVQAQDYNYAEVLQKSMFFYEAQRSGELPADNRVTWRANSAMDDGSDVGYDLTGGWYDAGDHVKFNFPMAFSATVLAWGAIDFADGYTAAGQMDYLKSNLRFVNDYLLRCHTAPNEFWGQVGNGGTDHAWWGSAEVMAMERPSYKIDARAPGSDLAGEAAAAMAAASMVFAAEDPAYADTLIAHAIQLYNFADTYRGVYSTNMSAAAGYYTSYSGYNDELVWGAIWLYRATGDEAWLTKAKDYYANLGTESQTSNKSYKWGLGWDDKSYGCYALMAKLTGEDEYKADTERNLDFWTDGYNGEQITYTPGGLAYLDTWGALRYSLNTSFIALYYHDMATTEAKGDTYYNFAVNQMNYALGDNPRSASFVCGFGTNPPVNPHHRTAHGAWANNLTGPPALTRHTLYGALVGGPNSDDSYEDDRSNYVNNEVACDYNAGFSGVLAALVADFGGTPLSDFPVAETPEDEYIIEAKINGSGTTYTEWSVWVDNHTAWPARQPSKYVYRLFVDITEGLAAGYTAADYVISSNNAVVTYTDLLAWDEDENIYYTEVTYNADVEIWPGGQAESTEESQIRIRLPYEADASAWDASNDWSYQGLSSTLATVTNIPLYVDDVLVYGETPTPEEVVPVTGVSVPPVTDTLDINQAVTLTATIAPTNATTKTVTWTTSDATIATVSTTGLVTAVGEGTATITATTTDGGFTAEAIIVVSNVVAPEQYTLTTTVSGSGTITLSPAGGVYDEGTEVTLTATPATNYTFDGWSGDVTGTDSIITVTMTSNLAVTATFSPVLTGGDCENPTVVSLPFTQEGAGEYCFFMTGSIDYVNSWNMTLVEINGVDYTNTWSNSLPETVDGGYYVHYVAPYDWSHFEADGSSSATSARMAASTEETTTDATSTSALAYPNPTTNGTFTLTLPAGTSDEVTVTVVDPNGNVVLKETASGTDTFTLGSTLPAGLYHIKVYDMTHQKIISTKLMKK